MSLKVGIVGLPNVGKSSLFNALTKQEALAANYPFATIDPNVGVVNVPDKRMTVLNDIFKPKRLLYAAYEFIDIAGLVKGASKGEGLGNKFLSHIREVDAICEVVRCFDDENIIREGTVDPKEDMEIIDNELLLADLDIIENRLGKIKKKAETTKNAADLKEVKVLTKCYNSLISGKSLRLLELDEDEKKLLKSFNLLTLKPLIYLANIKESDINKDNKYVDMVKEKASLEKTEYIPVCVKLEEDFKEMPDDEKHLMLEEFGMGQSALEELISKSYKLLNLETFFTVGKEEVRAWTFTKGMNAKECAGIIHTDIMDGFIKAEIYSYEDAVKYKDEEKIKEAGLLRLEGKDYILKDGDICFFRFNKTK